MCILSEQSSLYLDVIYIYKLLTIIAVLRFVQCWGQHKCCRLVFVGAGGNKSKQQLDGCREYSMPVPMKVWLCFESHHHHLQLPDNLDLEQILCTREGICWEAVRGKGDGGCERGQNALIGLEA